MEKLVIMLLQSRTFFHVKHIVATSLSAHLALGEAYELFGEYADTIAEYCQGKTQKLLELSEMPGFNCGGSALDQIGEAIAYVQGFKGEDETLNNIIDELIARLQKIRYKLRFLS